MVRALIFDFDGLIVDSESVVFEAWAEVYRDHGEDLDRAFWSTIIGLGSNHFDPIADLEKRLGQSLDGQAIRAATRVRELELMAAQPVLPGVLEWRRQARTAGMRLGVASSSSRSWVTSNLGRLGLDGWDCICCRDDVGSAKPDPTVYLAVLDCLQAPAADAIAIEDSQHGVAAAKAAGIFCVAVPGPLTAAHDFARADLVLGSLAEMPLIGVTRLMQRLDWC